MKITEIREKSSAELVELLKQQPNYAARKGNADIAIRNIVGSNVFNILFVVGLSALVTPVPFAASFLIDTIIATVVVVFLLVACFRKQKLPRWAGFVMLAGYAGYLGYLISQLTL